MRHCQQLFDSVMTQTAFGRLEEHVRCEHVRCRGRSPLYFDKLVGDGTH